MQIQAGRHIQPKDIMDQLSREEQTEWDSKTDMDSLAVCLITNKMGKALEKMKREALKTLWGRVSKMIKDLETLEVKSLLSSLTLKTMVRIESTLLRVAIFGMMTLTRRSSSLAESSREILFCKALIHL